MRDTELQINLSNLSHNLNILKENTTSEIQGVLKASIRDLKQVSGISEKLATNIYMSINK